jgi:hypothetical protein
MQKTVSSKIEIAQALQQIGRARAMSKKAPKARTRPAAHVAGRMNKTEKAYSQQLDARMPTDQSPGEVAGWMFEPLKLRLADDTWYTPDFLVLMTDGTIEIHEVKACADNGKVLVEDDAQVKIKVAAEDYPFFTFRRVAKWKRKGVGTVWKEETYNTVKGK